MKTLRIAFLAILVSCIAVAPVAAQSSPGLKRITVASAVRVRSGPSTTAAVLDTLSIGVLLEERGRSERPEMVGDQQDYWYRVGLPNRKEGWVFGGLTQAVDPAMVDDAYVRIATERLSRQDLKFSDLADSVTFLSRAAAGAESREAKGRLELSHLLMVQKTFDSIPHEERGKSPYREWIAQEEAATIRLDEIQGTFLVYDELFWKVADKYADTKAGDELAWAAAEAQLGGECEGDISCNIMAFNYTRGRYLAGRPDGAHAALVVKDFVEYLESYITDLNREPAIYGTGPDQAEYVADYRKALDEARATFRKTGAAGRDRAIALLDEVEKLTLK